MENIYEHSKLIISRFDFYYDAVNNKGTYYLTLNSFLIGAAFVFYTTFSRDLDLNRAVIGLLILTVFSGLLSIIITLLAVNPFSKSGESKKYQSLIFYASISKMKENEFVNDFLAQTSESIQKDMLMQIHKLSEGLSLKYERLKLASWLVAAEFVFIALIATSIFTNKI